MIINTSFEGQSMEYHCNGVNDDEVLVTFVANLRKKGYNSFTVEIIGKFVKKNTTAITINNSGYTQITLDFGKCNQIISKGAFLNVNNVRVINCAVSHGAATADNGINTFAAVNSIIENCMISGTYAGGACIAFSLSGSRIINCSTNVSNNNGTLYGIYGDACTVSCCDISVKSVTASCYGIEVSAASLVSDSRFKGETSATDTTSSGNGGIGGGYYSNCLFVGVGALKGQGFYIRGGTWLTVQNCIYRGYTKNTTNGWGAGLLAQANEGNTLILLGINCNQETLTGYSQTKSMEVLSGYGIYAGTFYTAPVVNENLTSIASYNRNRS